MKTIACLAVHYGKEYLAWAVKHVQTSVDETHIFYAALPSYGFAADTPCPDTEAELRAEADRFAAKPIFWHRIAASSEAEHRALLHQTARQRNAQLYVVVDADEIWDPLALTQTIRAVYDSNRAHRWLTRFANFWRSFDWMVHDAFRPIRFVDLRHPAGTDAHLTDADQPQPVFHFGYAQSAAIMRYKMSCHGHKAEFRPNWLDAKFFGWKPGEGDSHPCVNNLWTPTPTPNEVRQKVRELLPEHPYQGLALID